MSGWTNDELDKIGGAEELISRPSDVIGRCASR
jgi:hypothetical protein